MFAIKYLTTIKYGYLLSFQTKVKSIELSLAVFPWNCLLQPPQFLQTNFSDLKPSPFHGFREFSDTHEWCFEENYYQNGIRMTVTCHIEVKFRRKFKRGCILLPIFFIYCYRRSSHLFPNIPITLMISACSLTKSCSWKNRHDFRLSGNHTLPICIKKPEN